MTNSSFFKGLLASIGLSLILSEAIIFLLGDYGERLFAYLSIAFFSIFCQVFYVFAKNAQHAQNPNAYIRLSIINVFSKIILVFVLVGVYYKYSSPAPHRLFLLPFLSSYLVFLCFETYFLFTLSNEKTKHR